MRGDEPECKRCQYPGAEPVACPKCRSEIEAVLVEEWEDGEVTVHCPSCHNVVTSVIDADRLGDTIDDE